jgi:hypothetical protein
VDPHPTYHCYADLDPDFYLMLIRIRLFTLMRRFYFAPCGKWRQLQEEKNEPLAVLWISIVLMPIRISTLMLIQSQIRIRIGIKQCQS